MLRGVKNTLDPPACGALADPPESIALHTAIARKSYRVGPNVSGWPKILAENPYQRPQVGPTFGPTL
jgi:hypothetical protein